MTSRYLNLLAGANQEQLGAICRTSHCVTVAGPGTGKTQTLILKAAKLLYDDIPLPRGLACVTYNVAMAAELQNWSEPFG